MSLSPAMTADARMNARTLGAAASTFRGVHAPRGARADILGAARAAPTIDALCAVMAPRGERVRMAPRNVWQRFLARLD